MLEVLILPLRVSPSATLLLYMFLWPGTQATLVVISGRSSLVIFLRPMYAPCKEVGVGLSILSTIAELLKEN